MKKIKSIVIFFLMVFAFSFSFEDSKIELAPKRKEPAKLTIGVHKLKSKPLPMDFDKKSKLIYGEINITDDQVVYVSESLDEIPSLTTSNGRRVVNNIKKYLTKDIKEAPKFTYQVKSDEESGKKYLLIKCKAPLENVYVYVVEKGNYHVKEVYKGQFNILETLEERENYGIIHLESNRGVFLNGKTIKYDRNTNQVILSTIEGQAASVTIFGKIEGGDYPKKYIPENIEDYYNPTLNKYPAVKIKLNDIEMGEQRFKESTEIENFKQGIFEIKGIRVNTFQPSVRGLAGTLKIFTTTESENKYNEHIKILLNDWFEFGNTDSKIKIQYGTVDENGNNWKSLREDNFGLKIDAKRNDMGDTTEGALVFTKEHKISSSGGTITFKESSASFNGIVGNYLKFSGKAPKKLVGLESNDGSSAEVRIYTTGRDKDNNLIETQWYRGTLGKDGSFSTGDITLKAKKIINNSIKEKEAGKIKIYANESSDYLKIDIKDWKRFAGDVSENIKIEYIAKDGKNMTLAVKTDILAFGINAPDEKIPEETDGQLYIYDVGYIHQAQLLLSDEEVKLVNSDDFNPQKQTMPIGAFPKQFPVNPEEVDWGTDESKWNLCIIDEAAGKSDTIRVYSDGSTEESREFKVTEAKDEWWETTKDFTVKFVAEKNKKYFTIKISIPVEKAENIPNFDKTYKFVYFSGEEGTTLTDENIIKTDIFRFRYEKSDELSKERKIEVQNPIVWYDYSSSGAVSNISHDRRVQLSSSLPITRNRNGGIFTKNTQLSGKEWIETDNLPDYNYKVGRHKVSFFSEKGESTKYTNSDGGTNSSTFINIGGDFIENGRINFNKVNGSTIMFSYDGGNKYLNFGVAKYEFSDTSKETEVTIFHTYPEDSNNSQRAESMKLRVTLPAFDGRPYISSSYDIQPEKDYIKAYEFNDEIGQNPVTIDYGSVGFKDLDIRITHQSSGEGIELRAYEMVDLINETGTYIIKGAKLYFENGERESADIKSDRTYFKGENEKSTFKNLKLWIPTQENLIPKSRFRIVKTDTKTESPLEVGVSVTGGKEFYKPVADLYLELIDKRYVETKITFENPTIVAEETSNKNWIFLNKNNYSGGKLQGRDDTSLWGTVIGDVIDIPVKHSNLKNKKIVLEVFQVIDGSQKILKDNLAEIDKLTFNLEDGTERKFLLKYVDKEDFIRFSLSNGYDENNLPKSLEFYIRYYAIEGGKENEKQFLFDHKYIINFAKKVDYLGDTTIIFKNPMEITMENDKYEKHLNGNNDYGYDNSNNKFGRIKLENTGAALEERKDHSKLEYDKMVWWEVGNSVVYPGTNKAKYESGSEVISGNKRQIYINHIGGKNIDIRPYLSFDTTATSRVLKIGIPNNENIPVTGTKSTYELNFNGEKYRLKMEIEPFNPTYYGRVYPAIESFTKNDEYQELNNVGSSTRVDRENIFSPTIEEGYIYIDLGTKYRDYLRYEGIYNKVGSMKVVVGNNFSQGQEVDIIPKENLSALPIKGKIVFKGNGNRFENEKQVKLFSSDSEINEEPIEYLLQVKVSEEEYRKLQPNTKYELFVNGNKNILKIGTSEKIEELKLDEPLNFTTIESGIEIDSEILDFGEIGLNLANNESVISRSATAKVTVKSSNISTDKISIIPESDKAELFYIIGEEEGGEVDNTRWLNVRDIMVNKVGMKLTKEQIEYYNLTGTVDVKNDETTKLGTYIGEIILNITLNPPTE